MYSALLDACVLVPSTLNDTLLRLAERGFYRPLWTQQILNETKWAISKIHPDIPEFRIEDRLHAMNGAFEDALVENWEPVCAGLDLPDPDDRHVWAAAIKGGAQTIVTANLKHFPADRLATTAIVATHPDDFLLDQLDLYPGVALQVLEEQAGDLLNPPSDLSGVLNRLSLSGAPRFADAVRLLLPESP
jgi:PIN domain-containing protein